MKSMNLFSDAEAKSSEALFGDSKSKENTNQLPSAPIQTLIKKRQISKWQNL